MATVSNWNDISINLKLQVIAGRTTVMVELLRENKILMQMLREAATLKKCIRYVNENF